MENDEGKKVQLDEVELAELKAQATKRQRVKTDLAEYSDALLKMMEADISLPLMLGWLEKRGKTTTLPALRRYVRKTFGEGFYQEFTTRNGWQKSKRGRRATDTAGTTEKGVNADNNTTNSGTGLDFLDFKKPATFKRAIDDESDKK